MSLSYRRPASAYQLRYFSPQARLQRACRALGRWLWDSRMPLLLIALVVFAQSWDGAEQLAAERERTAAAQAQYETINTWHRQRNIRVMLEGSPAQVADMAGQVAVAVRP